MKRSEINLLMREAVRFFKLHRFHLPAWALWAPHQWEAYAAAAKTIRENGLGWDLTDFGLGDFRKTGLLLFTIRNGNPGNTEEKKDYAEKIMIVREEQVTPFHFHWHKMEDIINRGGGRLCIQLHNSTPDERLDSDGLIEVNVDGFTRTLPPGGIVRLSPGESITLPPRLYHQFWGEEGRGDVLVGEVSRVNDDKRDNRFLEEMGRFPEIEEDEPPLYLLCSEYPV